MVKNISTKKFIEKVNKRIKNKEISKVRAILMLRGKRVAITRKKKNASKNEAILKREIKKLRGK